MVEGLVSLRLIVSEGFSQARTALLFLFRELVEGAQRVLDALHRADRILGIEVFRVEAAPPDKEFRRRLSIERKDPCAADLWGRPLYIISWAGIDCCPSFWRRKRGLSSPAELLVTTTIPVSVT